MKRNILAVLCAMTFSSFGLTSCEGIFDNKVDSVDDFEKALSKQGTLVLNVDIDGGGRAWPGCKADVIQGNGHTIRGYKLQDSCLFPSAEQVSNLVLEDITAVQKGSLLGIVTQSNSSKVTLDKVFLKESTLEIDEDFDRYYKQFKVGLLGSYANATDCGVEGCILKTAEDSLLTLSYREGDIGLLLGRSDHVTGCYVRDSNLEIKNKELYADLYVGGLVGYSDGIIENSYAEGNTLKFQSSFYHKGMLDVKSTQDDNFVGGLAGGTGKGQIAACYGEDNDITVYSLGGLSVGGLIGKATDTSLMECYDANSSIAKTGEAQTDRKRYAGQAIGYAKSCSVSNSFAYSEEAILEEGEGEIGSSIACGFSGGNEDTVFSYCASYATTLSSAIQDSFTTDGATFTDCYTTPGDNPNVNRLEVLEKTDWMGDGMIRRLMLTNPAWEAGLSHPTLNLSQK